MLSVVEWMRWKDSPRPSAKFPDLTFTSHDPLKLATKCPKALESGIIDIEFRGKSSRKVANLCSKNTGFAMIFGVDYSAHVINYFLLIHHNLNVMPFDPDN